MMRLNVSKNFAWALALAFSFAATAEDYTPQRRQLLDGYRLPNTRRPLKVAFFDADSTLRVSISGSVSANTADDVFLLPCVGARLREVADAGYLIAIVSNQGGIPQHVTLEAADRALLKTIELVRADGGEAHWYDFAENDDENRKPKPGMANALFAFLASKGRTVDLATSFMVGDSAFKKGVDPNGTHFSNSDRLFAHAVFADFAKSVPAYRFEEAAVFFGWRRNGVDVFQAESKTRPGPAVVRDYLKAFPGKKACPAPESDLL